MFAVTLYDIEYKPTKEDPDVRIKAVTKLDGTMYYEIILVYANDVLHMSQNKEPVMKTLG